MASPRSITGRLAIGTAAAVLTALTAAGPALAEAPGNPPPSYTGRVTAKSGLLLRDKPTRGSRIVGKRGYGEIVHIFCKSRGDWVNNNELWYLLTDGTWAWGSAAYIDNIGRVPRWC
ncbi:SH3 domain-containing protein [Streptomyces sp. NBC_01304]|uniref:SH3 domain-containing protein n=1 Tax=Streptomyces sp. NBC_01304 TaxID=2903818 RepID=UPI003FA39E94